MLLATKKALKAKSIRLNEETLSCTVSVKKEEWNIILTYMNKEKEDNWRHVEKQVGEQAGINLLILGEMNARTGEEGGSDIPERERKSKDKTKNVEGRKMLRNLESLGVIILNVGLKGDEEGKYT
ncbi:hypothetical protein QAD02_003468 [Eretmocerus hayati]|uniref:Uncharacterized protein n=1 Tax=Eretmocerus hayati TaxID=131215 RepID=A0ACC2NMC6_9HYME|nr:hypothetical protein QAD02_003468 [Eretmocerus hayati]